MKTKRIRKALELTVTAAVAAAMSAPLYAEREPADADMPNPVFEKLDTNRDGYVNRAEMTKLRGFEKVLNEADADRDGKLDKGEFVRAQSLYDSMRAKEFVSDSVITARVKAAFVKDKAVSALAVSVETAKGVVLLSGFVESEQQARRAQEIAESVAGVKSVKSNLVVKS